MRRAVALGQTPKPPARAVVLVLAALALVACRKPAPPAEGPAEHGAAAPRVVLRYVVGGDSRGEGGSRVIPWVFRQAKERGATALIFLGDMETRPDLDDHFLGELAELAPVPFYPVLGNHETAHRPHAADAPADERARVFAMFRGRFLGKPPTNLKSAFDDRLTYAVDLPGGVHFVALDNVSRPGFGADQLAWLRKDLDAARASGTAAHIMVGMHMALVGSGVTKHAMDEDGPAAAADSDAALALFEQAHVEVIFASHFHGFAEYRQHGIRSFISGGFGAPLDRIDPPAHHLIVATVPPEGPMTFEVVPYPGPPVVETERER